MSFNFGSGGNNNASNKPLFGAAPSSTSSTPSLFGSAANQPNAGASTPGPSNPFGSASGASSNLFGGGGSSTPGSSTLFGGTSSPATSKPGGIFGGNQASTGVNAPAASPFSLSNAGAQSAGNGNAAKASPFGSGGAGGGSSGFTFGGATTSSSAPSSTGASAGASAPTSMFGAPTATPAQPKTMGFPSTTPAGPPPGNSLFAGGQTNQAGLGSQQSTSSLFGAKPASTPTTSTPSLFGGASSSASAKPLGSTPASGNGPLSFGNRDGSADANKPVSIQQVGATGTSLFGGTKPATNSGTQDAQATPKAPLFTLGGTTPTSSTPTSKPSPFGFGATPAAAQPATSQPTTTSASANPLGLGGIPANKSNTAAPSSNMFSSNSGAGGNPFSGLGGGSTPGSSTAASGATATNASASAPVAATTSTSAPSLFSNLGATSTSNSSANTNTGTSGPTADKPSTSSAQTSTPTAAATGDTSKTAPGGLAGSTAGPAPTAQSRLKNKTMDEIITRWAADLSKYQKEFQQQAEQIAVWDRALVENSDKVKQLYSKTFQAERDASEVERQLRIMEENQQELEMYLDRYEKEVENRMRDAGVGGQGRSDGLRGPDQDRERTYKLAEKLQDRLNELNKDLTEMIEEINTTSQNLSKTGKPDDPLTKVVRVLNSQLSQLQQIENGTSQLQTKINAAQKESQRAGANGWSGLGTDSTEDFYRSFRGQRSERFGGVS